jgi:hypothetical protein
MALRRSCAVLVIEIATSGQKNRGNCTAPLGRASTRRRRPARSREPSDTITPEKPAA